MFQQKVHQGEMAQIARLGTAIVATSCEPASDGRDGAGADEGE
jgi:hypothetical protein